MEKYKLIYGFNPIQERINKLYEERKHVQEEMVRERAHGDLRENYGYHAAKQKLNTIDQNISKWNDILNKCVEYKIEKKKYIDIGAYVEVKINNNIKKFQVVSTPETNSQLLISEETPLVQNLKNIKPGENFILNGNQVELIRFSYDIIN